MVHEDRISNLPSDILISIISRLTLQEATATCILSTRWRNLHCYVTHLNFPKFTNGVDDLLNHISMVNHVLSAHKGSQVKVFRVDMYDFRVHMFEKLFEFALTKKAETIHLHVFGMGLEFIRLPSTILSHGLGCLKELSLCRIPVTDQDFELMVSNCTVLECLTVKLAFKLKKVSIVGLSKLRRLNLSNFTVVESIVIRDKIRLVYLSLCNLNSACFVQLSNIPKLTKLCLKEGYQNLMHVELLAAMPSCIRDQLLFLRLSTRVEYMHRFNFELLNEMSVELVNIKHLQLGIEMGDDLESYFLRYVCRLVKACRSLERLMINFPHRPLAYTSVKAETYDEPRCELSLKYLLIIGYLGCTSERELALYVINSARALKKLTIVACDDAALARARHDFQHIRSARILVMAFIASC